MLGGVGDWWAESIGDWPNPLILGLPISLVLAVLLAGVGLIDKFVISKGKPARACPRLRAVTAVLVVFGIVTTLLTVTIAGQLPGQKLPVHNASQWKHSVAERACYTVALGGAAMTAQPKPPRCILESSTGFHSYSNPERSKK
jgi:hypothetical protein